MASLKQYIAPNDLTIASTGIIAIKWVECPNSFFSRIVVGQLNPRVEHMYCAVSIKTVRLYAKLKQIISNNCVQIYATKCGIPSLN